MKQSSIVLEVNISDDTTSLKAPNNDEPLLLNGSSAQKTAVTKKDKSMSSD
jgi:hypothetical protein